MSDLSPLEALKRGVAAHQRNRFQEAEGAYRTILQSVPVQHSGPEIANVIALTYNNLGVVLQQQDRLDEAIVNYQEAVRIKPDYHEAHYNLGATQHLRGDLRAAIDSYRHVTQIKPDYIEAWYQLGNAYRDNHDPRASIDCFRHVTALRPHDADAYNNLGAALQHNGELDAAIDSYQRALEINPALAEVCNNRGSALQARGDLDAAVTSFERALKLNPDYENAWNNLGHALFDRSEQEAALDCYRKALQLSPRSAQAHNNLGNALRQMGRFAEAIEHFDTLASPEHDCRSETDPAKPRFWSNARSQAIECLYLAERYEECTDRLRKESRTSGNNLRIAAVSAFISQQLAIEDPYPFCPQPLDYLRVGSLRSYVDDVDRFANDLIEEASQQHQVWEPRHGVTRQGFQTSPTIFSAGRLCAMLEQILRREIASYQTRFADRDCVYMQDWPERFELRGWFVRLLKQGYQNLHNHPAGWLSGVVYLKTVEPGENDEGALELSLRGHDLPVLRDDYPRKVHCPQKGDIVLFPSSVFHRTIPFKQDAERCVIAFDLNRYSI